MRRLTAPSGRWTCDCIFLTILRDRLVSGAHTLFMESGAGYVEMCTLLLLCIS